MYERFIKDQVNEALSDTPVVFIQGPRQVGKTTFVKHLITDEWEYSALDEQSERKFAQIDPVGFLLGRDRFVIDEVQRAPDLFREIKISVDEDRRPGRFILTGSADVLLIKRISDSLAGRIEIIDMLPLSQSEISGKKSNFLDNLFSGKINRNSKSVSIDDVLQTTVAGGFPESLARKSEKGRIAWAKSYLNSLIHRDLRELSDIKNIADLPKFVDALALNSGQPVNYTKLGNCIDVSYKTGQHYFALFEQLFLIGRLRPWHCSKTNHSVKSPKLHFLDSGLLAATLGLNFKKLKMHRMHYGQVLESFVYSEVLKLMKQSEQEFRPYFFRDSTSKEVDIVLERDDGMVAGIVVKSSATVQLKDFAGLKALAKLCGDKFAFGVLLNIGIDVKPFGDRLAIAPVSSLWS